MLKGYETNVRPVENEKDTVVVGFDMSPIKIDALDEERGVLELSVWLHYNWMDVQLKWNPADYGGIDKINIPIEKLWIPDVVLYNSVGTKYEQSRPMAVVLSNGLVIWIPTLYVASDCPTDLTGFPFDTQRCKLKFGSWTYDSKQVNLTMAAMSSTKFLTENKEFEYITTERARHATIYPCCPEEYIDIEYTIVLKRKSNYATHLIIAPSVIINLILPAIFILPPDSKEKINFGTGLLLTNSMILTVLCIIIPKSHPTVPAIGAYHMVNMILIAIAIAISAVVLNIYSRSNNPKAMPTFVKSIFLTCLGKVLCVSRQDYMPTSTTPGTNMRSLEVIGDNPGESFADEDKAEIFRNFAQSSQMAEWRQLAVVIDRLCLLIYLVLVIFSTIALGTH